MNKGCLVNFRVTKEEREDIKKVAKEKKFRNLSCFLRYVVRKFYKDVDINENGIYNG